MPKQLLVRTAFTQGVKSSFDPSVVPPNAVHEARNVHLDESGILRVRRGYKPLHGSLGSGSFQGAISAFGKILGVWNRNVYLIDEQGDMAAIGTNTIGHSPSDLVGIIKWTRNGQEMAYFFGGNGIYETDGSSVSLVTPYEPQQGEQPNLIRNADGTQNTSSGPARCRFAVLRASLSQRIAAAGDPQSPNTVYLSAPLDATYWPADQVIQLPDDGGKITGLANWYGALVIFRDRDIWAFFGSDTSDPEAMLVIQDSSTGCLASRTIASVPGIGLMFLGPDNVYALQQPVGVENQARAVPMGDDIRKHLIPAIQDGKKREWQGVCAVYHDRQYRLCFPDAVYQDERVFRLVLHNDAGWFVDTGPRVTQYLVHNGELYGLYVDEGVIYRFEKDWVLDDMSGIPFYVAFRREDLQPGPARIRRLFIYAMVKGRQYTETQYSFGSMFNNQLFNAGVESDANLILGTDQNLDVSLVVDGQTVTVETLRVTVQRDDSGLNLGVEPIRIYEARFHPSLKGHFAQVKIAANQPGEDVAILGYGIEYSSKGRIRAIRS